MNAFYWSQANSIVIPAGILRDIFFDNDRPQYLNFGTIGYVIGHEITHGFDNIGAQFDEIGNARNWWKNETKKHYNEKAQCMIKQYKDYDLQAGLKINGDLTLKENIGEFLAQKLFGLLGSARRGRLVSSFFRSFLIYSLLSGQWRHS